MKKQNLFSPAEPSTPESDTGKNKAGTPLPYRMRPRNLHELAGQPELTGKRGLLQRIADSGNLPSLIFWGPPGSGKTSAAFIMADICEYEMSSISAVASGVKDMKEAVKRAQNERRESGRKTVFFVDEIHRFHKGQQSFLLPYVEDGTITLIGATTENPSFEVIAPLLSRCQVISFNKVSQDDIKSLLYRALVDERGFHGKYEVDDDALTFLARIADGDARQALNFLEIAQRMAVSEKVPLTKEFLKSVFSKKTFLYDKSGDEHYNMLSAYHKSLRGSDPDAAVYWMNRMLEAGEHPHTVLRRLVACASEDVGNADPRALLVAVAAKEAYDFLGEPEGRLALSQATLYVASAPKSNASCQALNRSRADVKKRGSLPVPIHLRNAPTQLMENEGFGKGYQYAHDFPRGFVEQVFLPQGLEKAVYYHPVDRGYEKMIGQWLRSLWGVRKYKKRKDQIH